MFMVGNQKAKYFSYSSGNRLARDAIPSSRYGNHRSSVMWTIENREAE